MQKVFQLRVALLLVLWISLIVPPCHSSVIAEQDLKQTEKLGSADQDKTSTETDHEENRDLYGPTASTDEQRPTSPPEFSSEADLVTKIPTTSENQKVNIYRPNQYRINIYRPDQHRINIKSNSQAYAAWKRAAEARIALSGTVGSDDCCFDFYMFTVDINHISSYYMTDSRCAKTAVVSLLKHGRRICADPSQPWVKNVITCLDQNSS